MKIAIVSHSSVHLRQEFFYKALSSPGNNVLVLGPRRWNKQTLIDKSLAYGVFAYKQIGLACNNGGSLYNFKLIGLDSELSLFKPDVIYCQQEWWSDQAWEAFCISRKLGCRFVLFCWENIVAGDKDKENLLARDRTKKLLSETDLVVCGNTEAEKIIISLTKKTFVAPQVGIDSDFFIPPVNWDAAEIRTRPIDLLYVGRDVPEKGVELIKTAASRLGVKLKIVSDLAYRELPGVYAKAKIFISIPFTTPHWKEQSGSYTNLEAMSCGVPVISSTSGAIGEYLGDKAYLIEEGKLSQLLCHVVDLLDDPSLSFQRGINGRKLILGKYSNEIVAQNLLEKFDGIYR